MFVLFAQGNNAVENTVEAVSTSRDALVSAFTKMWEQTALLAPKIVAMVVVLVLGYMVARIVARRHGAQRKDRPANRRRTQRSGRLDAAHGHQAQRAGDRRHDRLLAVDVRVHHGRPSTSSACSRCLGRDAGVVSYIPKLLVATVVVVIGLLVASFLRGVVATSADRVGLTYAEHLANGVLLRAGAGHVPCGASTHLGMNLQLLENMILIAFGAWRSGSAWRSASAVAT